MKSGVFQKQWEEAVVVHIPKELLDTPVAPMALSLT